jgi:hypothetical protein
MPAETYPQLLISSQVDGAALASSTTVTSILPGQAKYTIPSNFIDTIGKSFRLTASGRVSTVVTTPGTLTLTVRMGPTANIAVATSQAFALNVVAKTNVSWFLDLSLTVRSVGATTAATLFAAGYWSSEAVIGSPLPSAGGMGQHAWQASAPAVGTGFDSTGPNIVDLMATWSVNSASNSILCHQFLLESLN